MEPFLENLLFKARCFILIFVVATHLYALHPTYGFYSVIADGQGDLTHAERVLYWMDKAGVLVYSKNLLSAGYSIRPASLTGKSPSFYEKIASINEHFKKTNKLPFDVLISVSYGDIEDFTWDLFSKEHNRFRIFFSEYPKSRLYNKLPFGRHFGGIPVLLIPLGISGYGYLPPIQPIDSSLSKNELIHGFSDRFFKQIGMSRDKFQSECHQSVIITGYQSISLDSSYSDRSRALITHLVQAPLFKGKKALMIVSGQQNEALKKVENLKLIPVSRLADNDWHLLQQLADFMIGTGDSSFSDSFFFGKIPIWDVHKEGEHDAVLKTLKKWNGIDENERQHLIQYVDLLKKCGKWLQKNEFSVCDKNASIFFQHLDSKFVTNWGLFSRYVREKHNLSKPDILQHIFAMSDALYQITSLKEGDAGSMAARQFVNTLKDPEYSRCEFVIIANEISRIRQTKDMAERDKNKAVVQRTIHGFSKTHPALCLDLEETFHAQFPNGPELCQPDSSDL